MHVLDEKKVAIPDRPGNNRLDTLENLINNPAIGLMFMIPGINEVMRLNGFSEIRADEFLLERFKVNDRSPATVIMVHVEEVYMHCAKAITALGHSSQGRMFRLADHERDHSRPDRLGHRVRDAG